MECGSLDWARTGLKDGRGRHAASAANWWGTAAVDSGPGMRQDRKLATAVCGARSLEALVFLFYLFFSFLDGDESLGTDASPAAMTKIRKDAGLYVNV